MVFGVNPQVGPTAFLHCIRMLLAFLHWLIICSFQVSLLTRATPKNLVDDFSSFMSLSIIKGTKIFHFLFQVNITEWVFMALILRPLRLFCVISLKVSASKPPFPLDDGDSRVALSDRSSANPCMSHGILFLVQLRRLSTTRFQINGERIPPWRESFLEDSLLLSL